MLRSRFMRSGSEEAGTLVNYRVCEECCGKGHQEVQLPRVSLQS